MASSDEVNEIAAAFQRYYKHGGEIEIKHYSLEELHHVDQKLGSRDPHTGFRLALKDRIRELERQQAKNLAEPAVPALSKKIPIELGHLASTEYPLNPLEPDEVKTFHTFQTLLAAAPTEIAGEVRAKKEVSCPVCGKTITLKYTQITVARLSSTTDYDEEFRAAWTRTWGAGADVLKQAKETPIIYFGFPLLAVGLYIAMIRSSQPASVAVILMIAAAVIASLVFWVGFPVWYWMKSRGEIPSEVLVRVGNDERAMLPTHPKVFNMLDFLQYLDDDSDHVTMLGNTRNHYTFDEFRVRYGMYSSGYYNALDLPKLLIEKSEQLSKEIPQSAGPWPLTRTPRELVRR
jgi:hypothetical protein